MVTEEGDSVKVRVLERAGNDAFIEAIGARRGGEATEPKGVVAAT